MISSSVILKPKTLTIFFGLTTTLLFYGFGINDHIEQLPIIQSFLDDNYLSNDFFVESNSGYSPRYFYAKTIAFITTFISLPVLFFIGTLLSNILTSLLTFKIANHFFDKKTGIIAAALIMCLPLPNMGTSTVLFFTYFTPTSFTFPLILWAFYLFLKNKIILCLSLCGFASIFHVLIGFEYALLFILISILINLKQQKSFQIIVRKTTYIIIPLLFLIPNLWFYFKSSSYISNENFVHIVTLFRHPHHYVVSYIFTKEVLGILCFTAITIIVFLELKRSTFRSLFAITLLVVLCSLLISWVFIEIVPNKFIASLQLTRLIDFTKVLFLIALANYLSRNSYSIKTLIIVVVLILLESAVTFSSIKTLVLVLGYALVVFVSLKDHTKLVHTSLLLITGAVLLFNNLPVEKITPYQKHYFSMTPLDPSKVEVVDYIKSNTKSESLFLSPHDFSFLRTHAKRAIVVDFKAFPFQNNAMLEWYRRISDCYGTEQDTFVEKYSSLSSKNLSKLQKKYQFDYAVLYRETNISNKVIFKNSKYKIIDLRTHVN